MQNEFPFYPLWMIIFFGVLSLISIFAMWRVFEKAERPGWAVLVPIYNFYVIIKIGGKPGWWILFMLLPGVNVIFSVWVFNMLSKSFGKDEFFTLGLIVLPYLFWPILGFSDAKYLGPYGNPIKYLQHQNRGQFDFESDPTKF